MSKSLARPDAAASVSAPEVLGMSRSAERPRAREWGMPSPAYARTAALRSGHCGGHSSDGLVAAMFMPVIFHMSRPSRNGSTHLPVIWVPPRTGSGPALLRARTNAHPKGASYDSGTLPKRNSTLGLSSGSVRATRLEGDIGSLGTAERFCKPPSGGTVPIRDNPASAYSPMRWRPARRGNLRLTTGP